MTDRFEPPDDTVSKAEIEVQQISGWYWRKQVEIAQEIGGVMLQTCDEIDRYLEAEKQAKEISNGQTSENPSKNGTESDRPTKTH